MRIVLSTLCAVLLTAGVASAEMTLSFKWGDIPNCRTGKPGRVGNPEFIVKGVPAGTSTIEFRMKDVNVPSYNHGGGKVKMSQSGKVPFGVFKYKSPCPPGGVHTYEWTATAKGGGKTLARAKARRKYPE